ncbi:MAG: hypothetical protein AB7F40_06835 [Victivallaceae bacterium]|nr:hypothetical protein [Victivallaceae bacterium]
MDNTKRRSPWCWVPSLYFAEGVAYMIVNTVSILIFKQMGMSNTWVAVYSSFLNFPWIVKPLWTPLLDIYGTKRRWVLATQFAMSAAFVLAAFAMPLPFAVSCILGLFMITAFCSATHDAAADGIYIVELEPHRQAFFTGVRSTAYRVAMITAQGGVVMLAGIIQQATSLQPLSFSIGVKDSIVQPFTAGNDYFSVSIGAFKPDLEVKADELKAFAGRLAAYDADRTAEKRADLNPPPGVGLAEIRFDKPLAEGETGQLSVVRTGRESDFSFENAESLIFTRENSGMPKIVRVIPGKNISDGSFSEFRVDSGNFVLAWMVALGAVGALYFALAAWHLFALPAEAAKRGGHLPFKEVYREFGMAFGTFFIKKGIVPALVFILLYRFAESQLMKIGNAFIIDPLSKGGLGLTNTEYGMVYGMVGILSLVIGGLLGGWALSRQGLRFWMLPMALALNIPDVVYVLMSYFQPVTLWPVYLSVIVEQFGYGFGFASFMLFMVWFADDSGKYATSHFAIMTGLTALGTALPGAASGWIQEKVLDKNYFHFFLWVMLATLISFAATWVARREVPAGYGRKTQ